LPEQGAGAKRWFWHAKPRTFIECNTIGPHRHAIGTIINDLESVIMHYFAKHARTSELIVKLW